MEIAVCDNIVQCFFCKKYLIPISISDARLYKLWREKYGYIAKEGGFIGKKSLCKDCVTDIVSLIQGETYDY